MGAYAEKPSEDTQEPHPTINGGRAPTQESTVFDIVFLLLRLRAGSGEQSMLASKGTHWEGVRNAHSDWSTAETLFPGPQPNATQRTYVQCVVT